MLKKTSNKCVTKPDYTICFILVLVLASEYVVERFILQYIVFFLFTFIFRLQITTLVKKKNICIGAVDAGIFPKAVLNVLQG